MTGGDGSRHAAVSLWNSGVPATEVARRARHGVAALLKIYAHRDVGDPRADPRTGCRTVGRAVEGIIGGPTARRCRRARAARS